MFLFLINFVIFSVHAQVRMEDFNSAMPFLLREANDVDADQVTCKHCKWSGKKSALFQHLSKKSDCKSTHNWKRLKAEHNELKKIKKQAYNARHYANNKDTKRRYYQERREERISYQRNYDENNKEEKGTYYQENREERLHYQSNLDENNKEDKRNYYQENREDRLLYQRKYDEAHKDRKKEYRKLKAHYQKYNMVQIFQECDISHFKSHIEGRCGWNHYCSSHDYCWEEIEKQCTTCHDKLFKIKCQGRSRQYELNSLHCLNGCQVTCHLCGEFVTDFKYYLHFYVKGLNSNLKEKATLCPFRTYLEKENEEVNYTPCEICSNDEIQEKYNECIERIGVKYRYFVNEKTFEVTSIMTNGGRDILKCPFVGDDVQSTICLEDAIQKLVKRVNAGMKRWDNPEYTEPCLELDPRRSRHQTEFNLMCKLKKHIDLHTSDRVETHVVELTLVKTYTSQSDLEIIDTLIKTNVENFEQISKIKAIIPASECLGLKTHFRKSGEQQEPWLACVDPNLVTYPLPRHQWDIKRTDGKLLTATGEITKLKENLETISKEMKQMIQENKTLFMVIHTPEGALEEAAEFFEDLPIFPEWVTESKLLFTWSVKSILEEKQEPVKKSLIKGDFIQSKKYPSYSMNPILANLCECGCCVRGDIGAISKYSTVPVNGCSLPMKRSPLHAVNSHKDSKIELWRAMFNFAWTTLQPPNDSDSSITSSSESNSEGSENENADIEEEEEEDSEYCDDL